MKRCNVLSVRHHLRMSIFFLLCVLCYETAKAEYKPMLKDGRIWNCMEVYQKTLVIDSDGNIIDPNEVDLFEIWFTDSIVMDTIMTTYYIDGTEIIDNRLCYKLYKNNNSSCGYYYEENGKVYTRCDNEWVGEFDFTLEVGETCSFINYTIGSVDTISVAGELYRRLWVGLSNDEDNIYWIEGVGSTTDGPHVSKGPVPLDREYLGYKVVLSVYDGEKRIFEKKDFFQPGVSTDTKSVPKKISDTKREVVYDLQGRCIETSKFFDERSSKAEHKVQTSKLKKGVYIRDGRKVVVK